MRWVWVGLAAAVIAVFIAIEFLAVERFRPDPVSKEDFGTLYFENNARTQLLRTELSGRCSQAKALVEADLGKFNTPIMVWCANELFEERESNGRIEKVPYKGEISFRPDGSNSIVIRVSADQANLQVITLLFARARMLEATGSPGKVRGPDGKVKNGLGYYIADSDAKKLRGPIVWNFDRRSRDEIQDEDFAKAFKVEDAIGWLIVADLVRNKKWDIAKISRASDEEIRKAVARPDSDPFSDRQYTVERWCQETWIQLKPALKK